MICSTRVRRKDDAMKTEAGNKKCNAVNVETDFIYMLFAFGFACYCDMRSKQKKYISPAPAAITPSNGSLCVPAE